ncbi:odorant-binding protein-like [Canis lupus baileyi]|uniref:Lipocalin/cytosolic fatty-acid binding domain-containing protein n=1 Tax=Canis lupus familiaris TaxID=9615 RepID=A0A8C0RH07_CANLF
MRGAGDMKILLLCLALVLASDAQLLLPNVLTQVSGPWKTLYVSSNNLDKIAENGPFRIYIRRINVDIPRLKILFSFFVKVDGECVEKSVEASIGQDNLINAHYAGGNYHQILDVTPNALIGYIVNVDDKGRITKLASLVGRGAHVNEEDIAKFKKLSREKGIPEENIIYLGNTDNCPNHE